MFKKILWDDLTKLQEIFGATLVGSYTTRTINAMMPLLKGEEFSDRQQLDFIIVFLNDLTDLKDVAESDQLSVVQNIIDKFTTMLNPAAQQPQQPTEPLKQSVPLSQEALRLKDVAHPSNHKKSTDESCVTRHTAHTAHTTGTKNSMFGRNPKAAVQASDVIKNKIKVICGGGNRNDIVIKIITASKKHYKLDVIKHKDVINYLDQYVVALLVRTDIKLAVICEHFNGTDLAKRLVRTDERINTLLSEILLKISGNTSNEIPTAEPCNSALLHQILPVIITIPPEAITKDNYVTSCINIATVLNIPTVSNNEDEALKTSTQEESIRP